jgi:hypothetical protein
MTPVKTIKRTKLKHIVIIPFLHKSAKLKRRSRVFNKNGHKKCWCLRNNADGQIQLDQGVQLSSWLGAQLNQQLARRSAQSAVGSALGSINSWLGAQVSSWLGDGTNLEKSILCA